MTLEGTNDGMGSEAPQVKSVAVEPLSIEPVEENLVGIGLMVFRGNLKRVIRLSTVVIDVLKKKRQLGQPVHERLARMIAAMEKFEEVYNHADMERLTAILLETVAQIAEVREKLAEMRLLADRDE